MIKTEEGLFFSHSSIVRPGMHSSQQQKKCYGHCRFNIQPRFRLPSTTYKVCRHSLSCWILCTVSFFGVIFLGWWGVGEDLCSLQRTPDTQNQKWQKSTQHQWQICHSPLYKTRHPAKGSISHQVYTIESYPEIIHLLSHTSTQGAYVSLLWRAFVKVIAAALWCENQRTKRKPT